MAVSCGCGPRRGRWWLSNDEQAVRKPLGMPCENTKTIFVASDIGGANFFDSANSRAKVFCHAAGLLSECFLSG